MKRDLSKAIDQYFNKFGKMKGSCKGAIYASDVYQIVDKNKRQDGTVVFTDVNVNRAIADAMEAGFIMGMRYAQAEARRKSKIQ